MGNESTAGTNLRVFNNEENRWHMSWIDITYRKTAVFTAENIDGTVLMDGTNSQGRHIKNTFYNISKDSFDWKQEWTFDEGKTWISVSKFSCERISK